MMGEFEAESYTSEMVNSPPYFCLFTLFIFIIALFLLNLLTRLAVSDTQSIKSNAKHLSLVPRIKLIHEMESTLLQWYTFVEKWPKYTFLHPFINYLKSRIKNISLFPYTSNKKMISVLPNKGPNTVFEDDRLNEGEDVDELDNVQVMKANGVSNGRDTHILNLPSNNGQNTSCKMTSIIIAEATGVISNRSKTDVNNTKENFSQIQEALKENLSKIENKMEELFENYQKKLERIERKLEHDKTQSENKASQKMKLNATTNHEM
jgi:DNA-binding transcriptional MerR regulator